MKPPSTIATYIYAKLKQAFGYTTFRKEQEAIIQHVLAGQNAFVIMPTGGGKSLCYQIPALMQEGLALIISPLIALMKNQVDQLQALGINASFLNSTLTAKAVATIKNEALMGKIKLLYVAPETLVKEDKLNFFKQVKISLIAVDEAHCISDWGHDFRPEYRNITSVSRAYLGKIPIMALTATATPRVQLDILRNLEITDAKIFKSSFNRTNLYYEIQPKDQQSEKQLVKFIKTQPQGSSGIVYCQSRKQVEEIAAVLEINNIQAAPYHAGLETITRIKNQDAFLQKEVAIIVATIAFGMGIDKRDVRFIIHYDIPKSLEGYYQETGRAGRDGLPSICLMLYSAVDVFRIERLNKTKPSQERETAKALLEEVQSYALSGVCRRKQLLHYFGEAYEKSCGYCDNCQTSPASYEGSELLMLLIRTVQQTQERLDINQIINVLQGISDPYTEAQQYQYLSTFGQGKGQDQAFWRSVIRQSLLHGLLVKNMKHIHVLHITTQGRAFLSKSYPITLVEDHVYQPSPGNAESMAIGKVYDQTLLDRLKKLRASIAQAKGIPSYTVFQDASLEAMTLVYPITLADLAQVIGLNIGKAEKFGTPFIQLIQKYVEDNNIVTRSDILVKSKAHKSKDKVYIIQQIDRKINLEEIAESQLQSMESLIEDIEQICHSGVKLNLNYYMDTILPKEQQQEIYDYFMKTQEDDLQKAYKALGSRYEKEDIRLMRIKFLSEVAN